MNDRKPLSLAIIGAGSIANSYLAAFAATPDVRVGAIVDVDRARARAIAEPLGIPAFSGIDELTAALDCDGVIISAPPKYHPELAIDALHSGMAVLSEKPLAIGSFAALQMFAAADETGRLLTMASKFRFVEDIIRARAMIDAGAIGTVLRVENIFASPVDMTGRWNSRVAISGGGVLIDNGTHSVDIMRYVLGPLAAVYAVDTSIDKRYDACDDSASLFVRNASGVVGAISLSWIYANDTPWFLRVYGSEGTIEVGWRASRLLRPSCEPDVFGRGYDKQAAFVAQLENFAGAIRGEFAPAIDRDDAIASVAAIDAAYDSLRRNAWLPVRGGARRLVPTLKGEAAGGAIDGGAVAPLAAALQ